MCKFPGEHFDVFISFRRKEMTKVVTSEPAVGAIVYALSEDAEFNDEVKTWTIWGACCIRAARIFAVYGDGRGFDSHTGLDADKEGEGLLLHFRRNVETGEWEQRFACEEEWEPVRVAFNSVLATFEVACNKLKKCNPDVRVALTSLQKKQAKR
jgi:hypothetical protein